MRNLSLYIGGRWAQPYLKNSTTPFAMVDDPLDRIVIVNNPYPSGQVEFRIVNPSERTQRYFSERRLVYSVSTKLTSMRDRNHPHAANSDGYGIGNTKVSSIYHPAWAVIANAPVHSFDFEGDVGDAQWYGLDEQGDGYDDGPTTYNLDSVRYADEQGQKTRQYFVYYRIIIGFRNKNFKDNQQRDRVRWYATSDIYFWPKSG